MFLIAVQPNQTFIQTPFSPALWDVFSNVQNKMEVYGAFINASVSAIQLLQLTPRAGEFPCNTNIYGVYIMPIVWTSIIELNIANEITRHYVNAIVYFYQKNPIQTNQL